MTPVTDLSIESTHGRLSIEFDTSELSGFPAVTTLNRRYWSGESERRSAEAIVRLLRGERANLVTFFENYELTVLIGIPTGEGVTDLDERPPTEAFRDATPTPRSESALDHPSVPVDTETLVAELLRWVEARSDAMTQPSVHEAVDEARDAYDYYQRHGNFDGYEWIPTDDEIEAALFGSDLTDHRQERVLEYVDRHELVPDRVRPLVENEEPDADRALQSPLCHRDERVFEATLKTLNEYETLPSHVTQALKYLLWDFSHYQARVRRALPLFAFAENTDHVDHVYMMLDGDASPALRRTIVEALGEIGGRRARITLRDRREDDPDPGVRRAAADALDRLASQDRST